MNLTFFEIFEITHARGQVNFLVNQTITGVAFDSRKVKEGNLFIPLSGVRNGHDFVEQARENGAIATLWSEEISKAPAEIVVFQVEDTLVAMQQLATYFLEKIHPTVIAITGSNGKTSTKDLTASVLSTTYQTYKTQGNHNNEIGLPYTILSMPESTEKLVLEMGMDRPGDIRLLAMLAKPAIAVITLVGESHLEFFGSREKIAKGKAEIIDGLNLEGELIIPGDEPLLESFARGISQKVTTFGLESAAELQATMIQESKGATAFGLNFLDGTFEIPLSGSFHVKNSLIAAYIGKLQGVSMEAIRQGLREVQLTKNRTEWLTRVDQAEILSDVYNASPTAMKLMLTHFSGLSTPGKKVAILGDMLELGGDSANFHRELADFLAPERISTVLLYGKEMSVLAEILEKNYPTGSVFHFPKEEKQTLILEAKRQVGSHDFVFLKASNGMGLSEVVAALLETD